MKPSIALWVLVILVALATTGCAGENLVKYPEGYRGWTHVKSMVIEPGHPLENPFQGMHHVYGNKEAVKGLESGSYPDGSVLVFDLLKYKQGGKAIQEDERKLVGVMTKDAKAFKETGGWGFEGFAGNSKTERLVGDDGKGCFACHLSQEDQGFVFSKYRK